MKVVLATFNKEKAFSVIVKLQISRMFVSIFAASDDMIENENEMLRDRVCALEKKVYDQNDEITCLRATLADCLRRINGLELNKVTNHNPVFILVT